VSLQLPPPPTDPYVVFWQEQGSRFISLRQEALRSAKRPPSASYHPDGWGLEDVRAFRGRTARQWMLDDASAQVMLEFKGLAAVCAVAVGAPNTDTAWVEWLDILRRESVYFRPGEFLTETRAKTWRPEPDFEVVARGLLWQPLEIQPDPDPEIVSFELGGIDDVCGASDLACRQLANDILRVRLDALRAGLGLLLPGRERIREQAGRCRKIRNGNRRAPRHVARVAPRLLSRY